MQDSFRQRGRQRSGWFRTCTIYSVRLQNMKVISAWCQEKNVTKNKPVRSGCIFSLSFIQGRRQKDSVDFRLYAVYEKNECMQVEKYFTTFWLMNDGNLTIWMSAVWWMSFFNLINEFLQLDEWMTAVDEWVTSVWWTNAWSLMNDCSLRNKCLQFDEWMHAVWWMNYWSLMDELRQFDEWLSAVFMNAVLWINDCSKTDEWHQFLGF